VAIRNIGPTQRNGDHSLPLLWRWTLDGMVTPLQFKEERVLDKSLIPMMDKVRSRTKSSKHFSKISAESGNNHNE
jgi:hypothetical protein